ncbi:type VI secretion system tip protein VgrG, partial [Burkholderia sp. Bp8998]
TTIKGKKVSTPEQGATSESQPAAFASCDPLNFGLRFHHFIDGAKQGDTPPDMPIRRNVEYPVTKAYTAAIKTVLTGIEWGKFKTSPSGEISDEAKESIALAVGNVLNTALAAGPFGLPRGSSGDRMRSNGATPKIDIVNSKEGQSRYNMRPDVSASFSTPKWTIVIQEAEIMKIIAATKNDTTLDGTLKAFADMLYHEARHCQQAFWMMALLQ